MRYIPLNLNSRSYGIKYQIYRDLFSFLLWLDDQGKLYLIKSVHRVNDLSSGLKGVAVFLPSRIVCFSTYRYYITSRSFMDRKIINGFQHLLEVVKKNNFFE